MQTEQLGGLLFMVLLADGVKTIWPPFISKYHVLLKVIPLLRGLYVMQVELSPTSKNIHDEAIVQAPGALK